MKTHACLATWLIALAMSFLPSHGEPDYHAFELSHHIQHSVRRRQSNSPFRH